MAILPRTDRKLLSMVNGKPHATADDHEDPFPTPPTSTGPRSSGPQSTNMTDDEDINRDPESSDDDELPPMQMQKKSGGQTAGFRIPKVVDVSSVQNTAQTSFRKPNTPSHSKKRSSPPEEFSAQDDMIFSSSQSSQPKRKKPDAKPTTGNIHTVRPPPGSIPKFMFYGKNANTTKKKKGALKKAKAMSAEEATKFAIQGTAAAFKSAPGAGMEFQNRQPSPNFQSRTSEFATRSRSSSISSLSSVPSSPGVEEIQSLNLPIPVPYISKIECDICGSTIPLSLRQDFEDQFNDGKRLNYKWRDRFCRFHKEHQAQELWQERGYPNINWNHFGDRLSSSQHSNHLRRVLAGDVQSTLRDELEERLKGRSKTAMQSLKADGDKKQSRVGYYGPRGEKLMTEHIISHFGGRLRDTATRDRLMAAAGVSGGVSGFVQAILVPELAISLVMEDLKTNSADKVADVIVNSAELGELLHPESEDRVKDVEMLVDG